MDFFHAQDQSRRHTKWLVLLFLLAVCVIVVGVYLAVALAVGFSNTEQAAQPMRWWQPRLFALVATGTVLLIGAGSLYRMVTLSRGGGAAVARALGGRLVDRASEDPLERRLLNVVEEMAIAAGIAAPAVYVLDDEAGVNAFAAGSGPNQAVVAVTRGCLERLSRDELQGVIAHEFSHIFNGDMRLNLRLMGILHGILLIALIGRVMLRGSVHGRSKKSGGLLIGFALLAVGYTGVLFGRLIKAAVSRQREYLADASAVQFTRNPGGISGALMKIGGLSASQLETPKAEEASHMLFGQGVKSLSGLFATHPPIEERIARLDPSFQATDLRSTNAASTLSSTAMGFAGRGGVALTPEQVRASVGQVDNRQLGYARQLLERLPQAVADDLHDKNHATSLVYGLLVASLEEPAKVLAAVLGRDQTQTAGRALAHAKWLRQAGRELWLPLVELVVPTLRELSAAQHARLLEDVDKLSRADGRLSLFEFCLIALLRQGLGEGPPRRRVKLEVPALRRDVTLVLSLLAHAGHGRSRESTHQAFSQAAALAPINGPWRLLERDALSLPSVEKALTRLRGVNFRFRGKLVEACVAAISADGRVTIHQAELLRAIGAYLDCPVPPLLPGQLDA